MCCLELCLTCFLMIRSEDGDGETSVMARVLSTFLNELDGVSSAGSSSADGAESEFNVFVLAASEQLTYLDQALLRPGRLSHHVRLGLPSTEDIGDLLRFFCRNLPMGDDVCLDEVVSLCTDRLPSGGAGGAGGPSCAAISALTREAVQIALRERIVEPASPSSSLSLDLSGYSINDKVDGRMRQEHFLSAIDSLLPKPITPVEGKPKSFLSQQAPFEHSVDSSNIPHFNMPVSESGGEGKSEFKFDGAFSLGSK